jgi:hypothetical protein
VPLLQRLLRLFTYTLNLPSHSTAQRPSPPHEAITRARSQCLC